MKNTCQSCKWWESSGNGKGVCQIPTSEDAAQFFEIQADASDNTGLTAELITGPNFGCVLYTPFDLFDYRKNGKEYEVFDTQSGEVIFVSSYFPNALEEMHKRNKISRGSYSVQKDS